MGRKLQWNDDVSDDEDGIVFNDIVRVVLAATLVLVLLLLPLRITRLHSCCPAAVRCTARRPVRVVDIR